MSNFSRWTATALVLTLSLVGAGCATPPAADDPEAVAEFERMNDPLEPMNRAVFDFNQAIDRAALKPVAQGYHDYVPQYGRDRVRDFLRNLRSPWVFANDVLQGDIDSAVATLMRFTFNTAFGIGGLIDVVGTNVPSHDNDLGVTMGRWGIGEGPYLVLPILGPSNPRDTAGLVTEWVFDPVDYAIAFAGPYEWAVYSRSVISGVDIREANLTTLDEIERSSLDYYASLRSLYRQYRDAQIKRAPNLGSIPSPGLTGAPAPGSR